MALDLSTPLAWLQHCRHRLNCEGSAALRDRLGQEAVERAIVWTKERNWAAFDALDEAWSNLFPNPNPTNSDIRVLVYKVFQKVTHLALDQDHSELALLQRQPQWGRHRVGHADAQDADLLVRAVLQSVPAVGVLRTLADVVPRRVHRRALALFAKFTRYDSPKHALTRLQLLHHHLSPNDSLTRWGMRTLILNALLNKEPWPPAVAWAAFQTALSHAPDDGWRELQAQRKSSLTTNPVAFFALCETCLPHAPLDIQRTWLARDGAYLPQTKARLRQALLAQQPALAVTRPRRRS